MSGKCLQKSLLLYKNNSKGTATKTMLLKEHQTLESSKQIRIEKLANGTRADLLGAFAKGTSLLLRVIAPRTYGFAAVVLRIAEDGKEPKDLPLSFCDRRGDEDLYELTLDTNELCKDAESALSFYEILFLRGLDTCFSDSINNVDFELSEHSANQFRLLIYDKNYQAPAWFMGGTMYHIFVDRFFCGEGPTVLRPNAELNPDWEKGIPQYAPRQGMALSNNIFFGGNLWGVAQKLDYLQSLGVTVLYLSPVFEAYSNHRYDTANYEKIDGLLGGKEAFDNLVKEAHKRGMKIILDGVFNHTGDDSVYFNRKGSYPEVGAYQSQSSPYSKWFNFKSFPTDYESWWGIEIMPRLQHQNEECRHYFTGENGIAAKWLREGVDGWRLDVADELSDDFLNEFRKTVKDTSNGEGIIIGEVWENAVDKIAYGKRRSYFRGGQLDSVMNYPFRNASLAFLLDKDGETFYNILTELYGTYPQFVSNSLMNLLGTHDTERFLTRLGADPAAEGADNKTLSTLRLSPERRAEAIKLMKMASALQFTVFGVPSVYYGDEAGLEGHHDPFCRMPFPWGKEDQSLLAHYQKLGELRKKHPALKNGSFSFVHHDAHSVSYLRQNENDRVLMIANMGEETLQLPLHGEWKDAFSGKKLHHHIAVASQDFAILIGE